MEGARVETANVGGMFSSPGKVMVRELNRNSGLTDAKV